MRQPGVSSSGLSRWTVPVSGIRAHNVSKRTDHQHGRQAPGNMALGLESESICMMSWERGQSSS